MSLFCAMEKCKAKKGPCNCEKIMGIIAVLIVAFVLYRRFAA